MEHFTSRHERQNWDPDHGEEERGHNVRQPGQRDPERTKRAILEAATAEFVDKGYAGASVNEIADRANVNKRMLYHYFGKKDELYVAVLEKIYSSLRSAQGQLQLAHLPPDKAVEELIRFTWSYYLSHPEFLSLMTTENLLQGTFAMRSARIRDVNAPLMELLRDVLRRGQEAGMFKKDVDPLQLYLTVVSLGAFFVATRVTMSSLMGRDLGSAAELESRLRHITEVVLSYLRFEPDEA